jgi:hypothetical protein
MTTSHLPETSKKSILGFSRMFHVALADKDDSNYISSPLALWLLLALQTGGEPSPKLEAILGIPSWEAYTTATWLLDTTPKQLAVATAFWHDGSETSRKLAELVKASGYVDVGPVPTQEEADRWTEEHTLGMIKKFPATITPETYSILVNALATKFAWGEPFFVKQDPQLTSAWGVTSSLVDYNQSSSSTRIYEIDGEVFVSYTRTDEGRDFGVTSVIAVNPDLSSTTVILTAEEIVAGVHGSGELVKTFAERAGLTSSPVLSLVEKEGTSDYIVVSVPAWSADATHNLGSLPGAMGSVGEVVPDSSGAGVAGVQRAYAKYDKNGFEAAAVTALSRAGAFPQRRTVLATEVAFVHPYAVVAHSQNTHSQWLGMPVFTAWVKEAEEATD